MSVGASFDRSDLFQGALADYDVTAINEDAHTWRVFFHTAQERDRAAVDLRPLFPDLAFDAVDVPDDNWAARSQAALRAVRVGAIVVSPPWDVPDPAPAGALIIVILPSMGFGTGHHATTRLCLGALQAVELDGRSVIDVGTGSGVLAIAADRLGASTVVGFDDDADAVAAARDNLALNPQVKVSLEVGDLRAVGRLAYDVVLANLTGGLLIAASTPLRNLTKPGGRLILSGFQTMEESDVLRAFAPFTVERRGEEEEWLCVTLR